MVCVCVCDKERDKEEMLKRDLTCVCPCFAACMSTVEPSLSLAEVTSLITSAQGTRDKRYLRTTALPQNAASVRAVPPKPCLRNIGAAEAEGEGLGEGERRWRRECERRNRRRRKGNIGTKGRKGTQR